MANIVVLSGERGVGKTTVCRETVSKAQAKNHACYGLLTLTQPDGERDVYDVSSGDVRRLTLPPDAKPVITHGKFHFDPVTLGWGNALLAQASSCQLFVIDELGSLELEKGKGWTKAFDALRRSDFALALVVVRPELVVKAQLQMPAGATTVFAVTPENRDDLPGILLEVLTREIELR